MASYAEMVTAEAVQNIVNRGEQASTAAKVKAAAERVLIARLQTGKDVGGRAQFDRAKKIVNQYINNAYPTKKTVGADLKVAKAKFQAYLLSKKIVAQQLETAKKDFLQHLTDEAKSRALGRQVVTEAKRDREAYLGKRKRELETTPPPKPTKKEKGGEEKKRIAPSGPEVPMTQAVESKDVGMPAAPITGKRGPQQQLPGRETRKADTGFIQREKTKRDRDTAGVNPSPPLGIRNVSGSTKSEESKGTVPPAHMKKEQESEETKKTLEEKKAQEDMEAAWAKEMAKAAVKASTGGNKGGPVKKEGEQLPPLPKEEKGVWGEEKEVKEEAEAAAKAYQTEQQSFLDENAKKDGITVTESGLQYRVIESGNGDKHPTASSQVTVHYAGTLIDGSEFDSSYKRGAPASFPLNGVIGGWTEGVQLMKEGDKFEFFIPYHLGYGARGSGRNIPPFATLVFTVELLSIDS